MPSPEAAADTSHVIQLHNGEGSSAGTPAMYSTVSVPSDTSDEFQREVDHGVIHLWDEDSDDEDTPREPSPPAMLPFALERRAKNLHVPSLGRWWRTLLIGSAEPGSLTVGHVAMNLFSSSLHPGVLLAMPVYFVRAGIVPGMLMLVFIALLGGFGGGLWVTLGRYVGGNTLESITGKACGMHTRWKRNLGYGISSIVLVVYCTGAAVVGYHAMTDLLLQVFFHYAYQGDWLHDRAFVTFAVGGVLTLPLLLTTAPKRHIIQIQSWSVVLCYPVIIGIMFARMNDWHLPGMRVRPWSDVRAEMAESLTTTLVPMPSWKDYTWPWASTSMLPLLTLSAVPAQILAHNRSLRRKFVYESNAAAFLLAQLCQVTLVVLTTYVLAVDIGMFGTQKLLGGLHANFFSSFPLDDDYVNAARLLFSVLLAAHLVVCLASARSSWSRLLNLFNVHPLRSVAPPTPQMMRHPPMRRMASNMSASPRWLPPPARNPHSPPWYEAPDVRRWRGFRTLRSALAGVVLWTITAVTAFSSGVGGFFRRNEREGEELRFLRSIEAIGIGGALVGFILPSIIWVVLFWIRRPRAILLLQSKSMRRRISKYVLSPLSALIGTRVHSDETESLLSEVHEHSVAEDMPNHNNEQSAANCDDATLILLARKERQLQQQSLGRRRFQEFLVVVALMPFGLALVIASAVELLQGGY